MFAILRHYGILAKIVDAIPVLYDETACQVFLNGHLSEPFDVTTGVLQGDVLAPFLFIIVIDYVSRQSAGDFGFLTHKGNNNSDNSGRSLRAHTRTVDRLLNDLAFADDIALLENDTTRAQQQLDALRISASKVGLEINVAKTEQMRLNLPDLAVPPPNLLIDGQKIAIVEDFKYLGAYMASTGKDVQVRIGQAWGAFAKIKSILLSPKPTLSFKIRLFNAACISILLYGCESWVLTDAQTDKLDKFARKCYRQMLGIRISENVHFSNDNLYNRVDQPPISELIRRRQLKFTGHILRMPIHPACAHLRLIRG